MISFFHQKNHPKEPSPVLIFILHFRFKFITYKPDKRGRFYKRFDKVDKDNTLQKIIKSFAPLKDYELSKFVSQESKDLNLDSKVIETLIHKV